jgi:hypothetical protein
MDVQFWAVQHQLGWLQMSVSIIVYHVIEIILQTAISVYVENASMASGIAVETLNQGCDQISLYSYCILQPFH